MAAAQAPSAWMLETTVRDILAMAEKFADAGDRARLEEILRLLSHEDFQAESTYD
jgi:hypothetical protein